MKTVAKAMLSAVLLAAAITAAVLPLGPDKPGPEYAEPVRSDMYLSGPLDDPMVARTYDPEPDGARPTIDETPFRMFGTEYRIESLELEDGQYVARFRGRDRWPETIRQPSPADAVAAWWCLLAAMLTGSLCLVWSRKH